ncbi:MAG: hypothetical protein ACFNUT_03560 [Bacteroidota bacterium]
MNDRKISLHPKLVDKESKIASGKYEEVINYMEELLHKKQYDIDDIAKHLPYKEADIVATVRKMLDEGRIVRNDMMKLVLTP